MMVAALRISDPGPNSSATGMPELLQERISLILRWSDVVLS